MGTWIICQHCGNVVPYLQFCDVCKLTLPSDEISTSNNTGKLCRACQDMAEVNSDYCWRCKPIKEK